MRLRIDRRALLALAEEAASAAAGPRARYHPEEGVRAAAPEKPARGKEEGK